MKCDLSIIVPIYNVEKYVEQAITSLLQQKEYNYEIILVNDGSTDCSRHICEKIMNLCPDKVSLINKPNGGLPSARKAGVRMAQGEYISFLDGDDWIDADYYYNMVMSGKEHDAEVVCSSYKVSYPNKEVIDRNAIKTGVYVGKEIEGIKKRILYNPPYYTYGIFPSLCMKIIKKRILEKYIFNVPDNVSLAEDAACTFPILFSCKRMVMLSENVGYHYRQNEASIMNRYDSQKLNRVITIMDYLESVFQPYYEKYDKQIDKYYTQLIKEFVKNELLGDAHLSEKVIRLNNLLQKHYITRTLQNLNDYPISYRLFFWLIREKKFLILNVVYILYKKMIKMIEKGK